MEEKLRAAEAKAVAAGRSNEGVRPLYERWSLFKEDLAQIEVLKETRADIFELLEGFRIWASAKHKMYGPLNPIEVAIGPYCVLYAGVTTEEPRFPGAQEAKFFLHPDKRGDVHGYYWAREWQAQFWSKLAEFDTETIAESLAYAIVTFEYTP